VSSAGPARRSTPEGRAAERQETELLSRLGLDRRATPEDIETAHDEVTAFLATAPRALRDWAHVQVAAADEALASLSDPAAVASFAALAKPALRPAFVPGGPATPPARREVPPDDTSTEGYDALFASVTPSAHRDQVGPARIVPNHLRTDQTGAGYGPVSHRHWGPARRLAIVTGVLIGAVVIAVVGYNYGAGSPAASPIASDAAAQAALKAKVAPLMVRIQANPNDADALMSLGDAYFQAGQYPVAVDWFEKLVAVQPKDEQALLALGAASFNVGDLDRAEVVWQQVVSLDATSVEAHYDLGFLYLNRQPPDMAGVKREWGEVVRLDPGSDVAKTVTAHLQALESPAPSGSSPTVTPTPVASPGSSPGASQGLQP
jgi:cytochrome c-type biogenesis protein CcmH/NrfG